MAKVMSGARAILAVVDPNPGATKPVEQVGIFNNVSWGLTYDAQPVYILGSFGPAEIEYTAQEPVNVTCSGWRVIDHGGHKDGHLPRLQDLLNHEYLSITIVDRKTQAVIATIRDVRPTGYSTTLSARNLEEITVTFVGIRADDESTENSDATEMKLP